MEHIVQFAIGIDDETIRQRVIDCAYDDVVKKLIDEAKKELGFKGRYYHSSSDAWRKIIEDALHKYFDENKDLIFDLAAEKLADSYKRTKAFKEKMEGAIE